MSGVAVRTLRDVLRPRNDIVHPRDSPTGVETFVGLEHIEPHTGRRIGAVPIDLGSMTGRKARFLPGDIVYGYLRPYLNKVWIAEFAGFCSVDQYVFAVVSAVADTEYVALYLRSPAYLEAAPIDETPGQLPRIRLDEVLSTPIPLPPLDEQRRIAARLRDQLGETERARAAVAQTAGQLSELEMRTVDGAFGGPVRHQSHSARLDALAALADGDWILTADYSTAGVRLLQVGDIGIGTMRVKSRRWLTMERARELKCTLLEAGDVLISRMPEPLGRAAYYTGDQDPAITAVDVTIARLNNDQVDRDYLLGYLRSSQWFEAARAKASGATRPRISRSNLGALLVPIPTVGEQRRIAARLKEQLAEIDRAKATLEAQRVAIEGLPAALLREAFGSA